MKKFSFSLQTLKGFKEQVLDREKNDLAMLNAQRAETLEQLMNLEQELRKAQDEFNEKAAGGISPMEMMVFTNYHKALRLRIEETHKEIEQFDERIERQTGVVVEASKEVNSLEKLEEKQLEDYKFKAAKADERFIEEFVNNNAVRAGLAEKNQ
ncbi:MAG: flagellar export protein FliJ [Huintestinicola sp.]